MQPTAVVLLSGGIDSAVCLALSIEEYGSDNVVPLNIRYGQKHSIEHEAAHRIWEHYNVRMLENIVIPKHIFGEYCTLIEGNEEVPEGDYDSEVPSTYVPFRNGLFLSIAAAYAATGTTPKFVVYGAHIEDFNVIRRGPYPDTSFEFNGAMASAISTGTNGVVKLQTPLQWMSKAEIVKLGLELGVPFELTYSCYNGREKHCGKCATCISRINAFKANKAVDPVEYEIDVDFETDEKIDLMNRGN